MTDPEKALRTLKGWEDNLNRMIEIESLNIHPSYIAIDDPSGFLRKIYEKLMVDKPKRWTRKRPCPSCGVNCGTNHKSNCNFDYAGSKRKHRR